MPSDTMPCRPDCEFHFNLPHSFDPDEEQSVEQAIIFADNENRDDPMEGTSPNDEDLDALFADYEDNSEQPLSHDRFPIGFSDNGGAKDAFDRSWDAHQAKRQYSKKTKKSPRRSEVGDKDDDACPRIKRPRKLLFGDPGQEVEEQEHEEGVENQDGSIEFRDSPQPGLRNRLSSLNLDQQEAQDTHIPNLGFGPRSSEIDSASPGPSRAPSEESVVIPPDDKTFYELRQHIDRRKATTYVDTDRTGNYDPAQEAKLKTLRAQKAKAVKSAKKKGKGKTKERAPKEHVSKFIVQLRFKAFGNLRNITNDEENWPKNWSEIDSDDEEAQKEYCDYYRRNTPGCEPQIGIEDPSGELEDMTGYAAARGCEQCRIDNKVCSMNDGGTFPCEECKDEEHLCEPIRAPTTKGRCKQCVNDDQETCSFKEDPDQAVCDECMASDQACESLPPTGYKTPHISIDEIMYGPDRRHTQCTSCRSEKKRCSLKKKTDKPPCNQCKKNKIGCTFYDLLKTVVEKRGAAKKSATLGPTDGVAPEVSQPGSKFFSLEDLEDMDCEDEEMLSREATPEIEMEDDAGNKGMLTKIKTSFAHPIEFNVEIKGQDDCNFCEMPMFGFVGYFECEVHVIRWYSGLGFTELGGGHREVNGATTMCVDCTNTRLGIIFCEGHEIDRLTDTFVDENFRTVATELMDSEPGSQAMRYQLQRWCSMCSSVATWGCAKVQPALTEDDGSEVVSCGLRLCDRCTETLRDDFYWDSGAMAEDMIHRDKANEEDEETGELERKPRADVEFLRKNSLLMNTLTAGAEDYMEEV